MANVKQILEAVDAAMTTIKNIADTPGINLIPYVSTLSSVIGGVHMAYTAGKNIEPYITAIKDTYTVPGSPTPADIAALDARIADLVAQVQAPLPAPEEGEED